MTIEHVTPAGGNVFADLGFERAEAESLKIRSDLMIEIRRVMETRGLQEPQAAELFGVGEPRIREIAADKIGAFSIEALVGMLAHAGLRVEVRVPRVA